ncbi:MAG: efflux RND transporter periplasmic adaptor subunit, partial [Candidatus Latescibacteria bacterium]|nr:efflux RND transporter periplasmic adaptor subunit [Candidatus Latescibacterota bacterium]
MKRKILGAIAIVLVVGAGVTIAIKKQREIATLSPPRQTLPTVQVAPVAHGTLEVTSHYLGTIEPYTQADLSSRISGNLLSLTKREGDAVQAGEIVAVIDDQELAARAMAANAEVLATRQRLAGAQSAYETQKAIYARDETLFAHGAISREALERSRAALDGVRATVGAYEEGLQGLAMNAKAAQTQAGYARIAAPFAGIVTRRWMEPGDLAVPGKPILSLEQQSPYKVTVQVPQEELGGVRVGSTAYISYQERTL